MMFGLGTRLNPFFARVRQDGPHPGVPPSTPPIPPEIWLHILSFLPDFDLNFWEATKIYCLNSTFLDYYIRNKYHSVVLDNPLRDLVPYSSVSERSSTQQYLSALSINATARVVSSLHIRLRVHNDNQTAPAPMLIRGLSPSQLVDIIARMENLTDLKIEVFCHSKFWSSRTGVVETRDIDITRHIVPQLRFEHLFLPSLQSFSLDSQEDNDLEPSHPQQLIESARVSLIPFLKLHQYTLTILSLLIYRQSPHYGDAFMLEMPHFPLLRDLTIHIASDCSLADRPGATQLLRNHANQLQRLKLCLMAGLSDSREDHFTVMERWKSLSFWSVPLPTLEVLETDFRPWDDSGLLLRWYLSQSNVQPKTLIVRHLVANPNLGGLIQHIELVSSGRLEAFHITLYFLHSSELGMLARRLSRLRHLEIRSAFYSRDRDVRSQPIWRLLMIEETHLDHTACRDWALQSLEIVEAGDEVLNDTNYRNSIATALPNVQSFNGKTREEWTRDWTQ